MVSGIFYFEIGRVVYDCIVVVTGVYCCINWFNSDVVVIVVGMNLFFKINGYNVVVFIVGGIVFCEEVFNIFLKWFFYKLNFFFRD